MEKTKEHITLIAFLAQATITFIIGITTGNASVLIIALEVLALLVAVLNTVITVWSELKKHIRVSNTAKINRKLVEFINTPGETIVVSRDLSWVTPEIREKLRKAVEDQQDTLKIFIPRKTTRSEELNEFADVRYFGNALGDNTLDRLTSRFTIVHNGTDSVRVTYPHENTSWHINTEYSKGDTVMTMASDIVMLLDLITRKRKEDADEEE